MLDEPRLSTQDNDSRSRFEVRYMAQWGRYQEQNDGGNVRGKYNQARKDARVGLVYFVKLNGLIQACGGNQ